MHPSPMRDGPQYLPAVVTSNHKTTKANYYFLEPYMEFSQMIQTKQLPQLLNLPTSVSVQRAPPAPAGRWRSQISCLQLCRRPRYDKSPAVRVSSIYLFYQRRRRYGNTAAASFSRDETSSQRTAVCSSLDIFNFQRSIAVAATSRGKDDWDTFSIRRQT